VKLSPQGSNVWLTTYVDSYGPTVSQSVLVDGGDNVYVSGLDSFYAFTNNGIRYGPYVQLTTIKYDSNGNPLWKASQGPSGSAPNSNVQVKGAALDNWNNVYLVSTWPNGSGVPYQVVKYASNGSLAWSDDPANTGGAVDGGDTAYGLAVNMSGSVFVVAEVNNGYNTMELATNGAVEWSKYYPPNSSNPFDAPALVSSPSAIAVDSRNNSYVTGYSPTTNSTNSIVTIKYSPNGSQVWLQQYNALNSGNDAGNAIAVDNNYNVYVTGNETLPGGGTGMVTIKYSPLILQHHSDGTVLLEAQGSPGESFDIQASEDLLNWLDLGTFLADTNGLMQFNDTNAPLYSSRFYYTNPQ
jgi:hypothetical protein